MPRRKKTRSPRPQASIYSRWITKLLTRKKLTTATLARNVGTSREHLSKVHHNKRPAGTTLVLRLEKFARESHVKLPVTKERS